MTIVATSFSGSVPTEICTIHESKEFVLRSDCSLDCSESCCHHTCLNSSSFSSEDENASQYEWYSYLDDELITCSWLELNDDPDCPNHRYSFENPVENPADSCEYCGECQDYEEWTFENSTCKNWYELRDEPGCPLFGWEVGSDNITANEACCWYVRFCIDVC